MSGMLVLEEEDRPDTKDLIQYFVSAEEIEDEENG
jgi:hypothetical protein